MTSCSTPLPRAASREELAVQRNGYFANSLTGFAEAMAHAVRDFRSVVDWLCHNGVDRIALTGMSLGGYIGSGRIGR